MAESKPILDEGEYDDVGPTPEHLFDPPEGFEDAHTESTERSHRKVKQTEKGLAMYKEKSAKYSVKIGKIWDYLTKKMDESKTAPNDLSALQTLKNDILEGINALENESTDYLEFLNRQKTDISEQDLQDFSIVLRGYRILLDSTTRKLTFKIQDVQLEENMSRTTSSKGSKLSRTTNRSNPGSVSSATRKKAKAEGLKASMQYVDEEARIKKKHAELKLQQAIAAKQTSDLETEMSVLSLKKQAVALEKEAQILEEEEDHESLSASLAELERESPRERTDKYVQLVTDTNDNVAQKSEIREYETQEVCSDIKVQETINFDQRKPPNLDYDQKITVDTRDNIHTKTSKPTKSKSETLESKDMDFTKFLLKKDLLLTRLTTFNDKPEFYSTWKNDFKSIIRDLKASTTDEIDLLAKWAGPSSQRHIMSIKASNSSDPEKALLRIWERLDDRFGSPQMVESALKSKLDKFPPINNRDLHRLYELSDILDEIQAVKEDARYSCLLAYFDSATGVNPVVKKLPYFLQTKWTSTAIKYMEERNVTYPPFHVFTDFVRLQSKVRNNPSFMFGSEATPQQRGPPRSHGNQRNVHIATRTTSATDTIKDDNHNTDRDLRRCPLHNTFHSLNKCKQFRLKTLEDRYRFLKEKGICYKCCESKSHRRDKCQYNKKCDECKTNSHPTALHVDTPSWRQYGGEKTRSPEVQNTDETTHNVTTSCTQICGVHFEGKSCAKTVLIRVYHKEQPHKIINMYAIMDDQSDRSLVSPQFFDLFGYKGETVSYKLSTCNGSTQNSGRKADGFVAMSHDGSCSLDLPSLIECTALPNNRHEIPTPDVALYYEHLADIAQFIPPLDYSSDILLLIGRDIPEAHHVLDQRIGLGNEPYGQKLRFGWSIIGETCLGKTHAPTVVTTLKTQVLNSGRMSIFTPCDNEFKVSENVDDSMIKQEDEFGKNVFVRTKNDDKPGPSREDIEFVEIMEHGFKKDTNNQWVAPLPFRSNREKLPNNRALALKRSKSLHASLQRDNLKREHFVEFMDTILSNGHAEVAPPIVDEEECWYLPIFGIYHPKKPNQLRAVFDSSAKYSGISLNDVLLTGPDLTNSLLGVLLRFRREPIAIMADIQQMFYCFRVQENHRNYLRFFWYEGNDPTKPMIEYRMTVHVFGNRPSPAVATYGLRKTAKEAEIEYGSDVVEFVENNFYVDDGLCSLSSTEEAIDLMHRTREALKTHGNLRLHKIASNNKEVLSAFPTDELAKNVKDIELSSDNLPNQRSLGLNWNLQNDSFFFDVSALEKPPTRRGVLSTINSIFDPLGFLAPIVLEGKQILRQIVRTTVNWDEPLDLELLSLWERWKNSLQYLKDFQIPRCYLPGSLSNCCKSRVHIYCDASEVAIAAVGYVETVGYDGNSHLGFIMGKAKLAPTHGHSIPRLELCAAVLAVEVASAISDHLNIPIETFHMYSDSRVVLGYILNTTRRFYNYVTNRVSFIRKLTKPEQWKFVPTTKNPADQATRPFSAQQLKESSWLNGPDYLLDHDNATTISEIEILENDKEVRQEIKSYKTATSDSTPISSRFSKYSTWTSLVNSVLLLKHFAKSFSGKSDCKGWHQCSKAKTVDNHHESANFIIRTVQEECYSNEFENLRNNKPLHRSSPLLSLDVFIDSDGILRVGGRLNRGKLHRNEKNPIVIPKKHHIATLIVRHYHEIAHHQGRSITSGTIRNAGFWIIGEKRLVSSVIFTCVKCKKLRGKTEVQKMANLPPERLESHPPFSYIGIDTFGPWEVVTRKTRGGAAHSKRWAVLFTCLSTRGVHVEVVEEMTSSSFINAFKRFVAIRGKVKQIRSDRGTNFIGAVDDLQIDSINVEDGPVRNFLYNNDIVWLFNAPHSSHMGGIWERLIGVTRRVLESMLMEIPNESLTHEVLTTFMAEASAIVNSRPLVPLSTDSDEPFPLSPSVILTQKPNAFVVSLPIDGKDMYRNQWKRVQHLSDTFWKRWRTQYLQTLQNYRKWKEDKRNVSVGDVVLLKDQSVVRNSWPMGIIDRVFPSSDGKIRKVEVRIHSKDGRSIFVRPVTELVVLLPVD